MMCLANLGAALKSGKQKPESRNKFLRIFYNYSREKYLMVKYLTWVKKKKQIKKPKSLVYSVKDVIGNVLWDRER